MKRKLFSAITWLTFAAGVLCTFLAALLCLLGLPAFMSTISGTTSLLLVEEGSEVLESSFVMAAGGIMLLVHGVLSLIQAVLGRRALKHGDFGKYVFVCGVIACSTLFGLIGDFHVGSVATSAPTIVAQALFAALAWSLHREQRHDGRGDDKTAEQGGSQA